jgi:thymidylate synthase (FAD)
MLKVDLLSYTPDPDRLVASAGRLCYSPVGIQTILEKLDTERVAKMIRQLRDSGHDSPLEHVSFSFGIEGISRALSHQLVRHRIASYSQQSQRYVKDEGFETIMPPSISKSPLCEKKFSETIETIRQAYQELLKAGIPAEDARYLLPNACETKIIVTMNVRCLLHFLEVRTCTRAQWEIRQMALEMRRLVREVAPLLFQLSGPTCETMGYCRESKMGCGRAPSLAELKAHYLPE